MAEKVTVAGDPGRLYDMRSADAAGTNANVRMMVAVLNQGNLSWFFRLSGEADAAERQRRSFLEFLEGVTFETAAAPGRPTPDVAAAAPGAEGARKPEWTVPDNWKEVPPTSMLIARFEIGGGGEQAEVTVSSFPGDVGGLVANINRWRGQIGLGGLDDAAATQLAQSIDAADGPATLVDMTGKRDGKEVRLVGIIIPKGTHTWFYKMVGEASVAGREKDALIKFATGARHPDA
jgi:hypothetical protein